MIEKEDHAGYERFHELPLGSSTKDQIENTLCGIQGWATYAGAIDDTLTLWEHTLPQERVTIQLISRVWSNSGFLGGNLASGPRPHTLFFLDFRPRLLIGFVFPVSAPMPNPFGSVSPNLHASLMSGFIGSA